jgi:hypothetical protein
VQWFPASDRDPKQGRGGADVASIGGFMENSVLMKKKSKLVPEFKENDGKNVVIESVFIN